MFPGLAYTCRRKHYVHAAYVNAALTLIATSHPERLRSLLHNCGVPEAVIKRTLASESKIRKHSAANHLPLLSRPYN